ncbi:MAG: winged helix-turn-helix domain-containing protein [Candidatus Rokubacteria bacterium]|nr:winged helix-turn-helix domain-containing protein [Candidatus Rokubacteria bacterium]
MATHVLVVEDEPDIRDLVVFHLEREGFTARSARSGPDALRQVKTSPPDLILLDLMLPELDGLEVCRRLRGDPATASIPVIMLTARGEEVDRGAPTGFSVGKLRVDLARHLLTVAGREVALTPKEFDLLRALLEARGRVLTREVLLDRVWGYARAEEIESRTVDVHIRRLREKLGAEGRRILTVKGAGYRFEESG